MSEWQPIETAPKDRLDEDFPHVILLCMPPFQKPENKNRRRVYMGCWNNSQKNWTSISGFIGLAGATHWMPLPKPPDE